MNEISLTIQIKIDPDLTKLVKNTQRPYTDLVTGEPIPKKTMAYKLSYRRDHGLYAGYVLPATYQKLIAENEN